MITLILTIINFQDHVEHQIRVPTEAVSKRNQNKLGSFDRNFGSYMTDEQDFSIPSSLSHIGGEQKDLL